MPKFTLNVWLSLIPLLMQFIKTAEDMFGAGTGAEKKQSVMDMIKGVFDNLGTIFGEKASQVPGFDTLKDVISVMVDLLVRLFNILNIFKK